MEKELDEEQAKSIQAVREYSINRRRDWIEHAKRKRVDIPNPPTTQAIGFFKKAGVPIVIDLGSGSAIDALPYLKEGFRVHAVDAFSEVVDFISTKYGPVYPTTLTVECNTLQHITFKEPVDIMSCVSTFRLLPKTEFPAVWDKVVYAIKPGGLFSFDLYGTKHQWANDFESYFSEVEVSALIKNSGLNILWEQYYCEETGQVLSEQKPVFEYWEFVCQKSVVEVKEQNSDEEEDVIETSSLSI